MADPELMSIADQQLNDQVVRGALPGELLIGPNGTYGLPPVAPAAPPGPMPASSANTVIQALNYGGPAAAAAANKQVQVQGAGQPNAGIGFTPGAEPAPAAAEDFPVGTTVPNMSQESAKAVVDASAGMLPGGTPVMTPANRAAANMAREVGAGMNQRTEGMAKRAEDVGAEHEFAAMSIADRTAAANEELARINAEQAKADEEQAKRTEEFQGKVEAGRKAWSDANKDFNPSRLLGDPGKRIGFTIATALGALGQAFLKGGPNTALAIINDALDRDIMQQKQDIAGKRENISLLQQQLGEYRQAMGDTRAARLGAKANALEGLAGFVDTMKTRVDGQDKKLAADQMAFGLRQQADEARRQSYLLAAKPSGRAPMTPIERAEAQQKLMKGQLANRQTDVMTQAAEAKANGKGAEGTPEAAINRRGKLATQLAEHDTALQKVDQMISLVKSGQVGSYGANAPSMLRGKAADDFNALRDNVMDATARAYGGPTTESDRETAKKRWGAIKLTDTGLLDHLIRMREITKLDRDRILRGQNEGDVAAIQKNLPAAKPTEEQLRTRLNTKRK